MPSRRQVLSGAAAFMGGVAGCTAPQTTTTGVVAQKQLAVSVSRTVGEPVAVSLATLTAESNGVVTGEYADIVSEVIDGASIVVPDTVHERLTERFLAVRYYANIVPRDGSKPVNGRLSREAFNTLTVGGTAIVNSTLKNIDEASSVSYLEIHETTARKSPPTAINVNQYDWDERAPGSQNNA